MWKQVTSLVTICLKPLTLSALTALLMFGAGFGAQTTSDRFPQPSGCLCPGENLTFECTIEGGGATVWMGTLLYGCTPEISIRHGSFEVEERNFTSKCQNHVTVSILYMTVANGHHYSQVNINKAFNSHNLNSSTVICAYDDGTTVSSTSGSSWTITDPLSSPVNVHLEQVNETHLHFYWDAMFPSLSCPSLQYVIHTTKNCGTCPGSTTSTSVMCELNVDVTTDLSVCSLAIQTMCGNMAGIMSDIFQLTWQLKGIPVLVESGDRLDNTNDSESRTDNTAAIAIGISVTTTAIIALIVAVIILSIAYHRRRHRSSKTESCIKFAVERRPRGLAKALKVIADLGISVTFVGTCETEQQLKWFCVSYHSSNIPFTRVRDRLERDNIAKNVHQIDVGAGEGQNIHTKVQFLVKDQKGNLAKVVDVLGDFNISINALNGGQYFEAENMREFTVEWESSFHTRSLLLESLKKNGATNLKIEDTGPVPIQVEHLDDGNERGTIDFQVENRLGSFREVFESLSQIQSFQNNICRLSTVTMITNEPGQRQRVFLVCIYPTDMREQLQREISERLCQQVALLPANNGPQNNGAA